MMASLAAYYKLTKPGIIRGNALAAVGGFLLASKGSIDLALLVATLVGTSLVIAAACVVNNILDRNIDAKMARTSTRALVTGEIPILKALIFSSVLGTVGFLVLFLYTNWITGFLGVIGIVFYVLVYGYWKRRSIHGTIIGSISGSIPPVAGYTAVTGSVDTAALLLFLVLTAWQMPHFYAIAIFRLKDYVAAGIPVLPAKRSMTRVKTEMLVYVVLFGLSSAALTILGYTGYVYLFVMVMLSVYWAYISVQGFGTASNAKWAGKVFGISLISLLVFCVMIGIDAYLP